MKDFTEVTKFRTVLPDSAPHETVEPSKAKKLYICSGQLYYELVDRRKHTKRTVTFYNARISVSSDSNRSLLSLSMRSRGISPNIQTQKSTGCKRNQPTWLSGVT